MSEPGAPAVVETPVPLAQLAAVHAAVGERFALDQALAAEGLSTTAWAEADVAWKLRLATDPACMAQYRTELAAHQDRLARPAPPIDAEIQQWTLFLRCYQLADDPAALLATLGLGLNDLARLQRNWARRLEDPGLQKQAAAATRKLDERLRKGERLVPPAIKVGEPCLVPSAASRGASAVPTSAAARAEAPSKPEAETLLGLDRYAALAAALEREPKRRAEILREHGVTGAEADAAKAEWSARFAADPQLRADFRALRAHYSSRRRSEGAPGTLPAGGALPIAPLAPSPFTAPRIRPASEAAVVISPPPEPAVIAAPPLAAGFIASAGLPSAVDAINATGEVDVSLLRLQALPFQQSDLLARGGATPAAGGPTSVLDSTAQLVGEVRVVDPLPFRPASEPPARAAAPDSAHDEDAAPSFDLVPMPGGTVEVRVKRPAKTLPFQRRQHGKATPPATTPSQPPAAAAGSVPPPSNEAVDAARSAPSPALPEFDLVPMPGGTVEVRVRPPARTLPFQRERAPTVSPSSPPPPRDSSPPPARASAPPPGAATSAPPPARASEPPPALGAAPTGGKNLDPLDSTMMLRLRPGELVTPVAAPPAPVAAKPAPKPATAPASPVKSAAGFFSLPLTSVEQLASFHAELAAKPSEQDDVRRRYQVADPAVEQRVEAHWRARFARHPDEQKRYQQLLEQYVGWLRSQRRG